MFDETTGKVHFAPNLGWWDVDFMPLFTHALAQVNLPPMPVYVQNEADTAALSEYEFVEGQVSDSLIFVTCDVGVGAGIVLNDRLFTGQYGGAGEIGHCVLQMRTSWLRRGLFRCPRPGQTRRSTEWRQVFGCGVGQPVDHL